MKNKFLIIIFTLALSFIGGSALAQEQKGTGPGGTNKSMGRTIARSKARAERKEAREKRKAEKANAKAIKEHHKRLQTKSTQKRMKKNRKKADKANRKQHL